MEEVRGAAGPFEDLEVIRSEAGMPVSRFCELIGIPRRSYVRWQAKARTGRSVVKGPWPAPVVDVAEPLVAKYAADWPAWGHCKIHRMMVADGHAISRSSFEYSPGVPIWHSRDLVSWRQIGNALTREDQFRAGRSPSSRGIYAATLRYRDGRFWLITTNIDDARGGHQVYHATDPAGPWSAPVCLTELDGIDPDLAWDDEGTCLVSYCSWSENEIGIRQAAVDLERGRALEQPRWIWHGTGLAHPEGPHLYRRD